MLFDILESRMARALLAQDVVVLAKLVSHRGHRPSLACLAVELSQSVSQIHLSLKRLTHARLIDPDGRPFLRAVKEFIVHGVKYAFPPSRGEPTRGVPTAYAAPPLNEHIASGADLPPVSPLGEGTMRGVAFEPLHKTVPLAAAKDSTLYELLTLIDALRDGRARERQLAERQLITRLKELLHDGSPWGGADEE
jgi:hypothetical protein